MISRLRQFHQRFTLSCYRTDLLKKHGFYGYPDEHVMVVVHGRFFRDQRFIRHFQVAL
jgi:hypothetical protein